MKKIILIATVLVVMSPLIAFAQSSEGYYDRSYVRLSYVKGDVYVQRGQDLGYEQGEVNLVVVEGDKIGTNVGRVEIQLGRRNYLRLNDYTQVDVVNLPRSDSDPTKLHLLSGSIFLRINSLDREKNFEIHTPDASFYILEEGLYRVDVRDKRETEFSVPSGSAEAAGEEGSVLVRGGEQVVAANGRFTSGPVSLYSRRDDFSDWNETRDVLYARRLSQTYLPADYSDYEYELADYGRWVNEGSYGSVWVPSLTYDDWRPYYHGRWVWYPIIGWTWVSNEPWGWCTSHYGRWGWRTGLGWYWIPHRNWYWGPAWVHWFWDYDYIGWCPLSYYNYPLAIVNNIFYDRYTYNNFPNNSRTLTVVRKDQLQNRRLTQVALDQTKISKIGKISLKSMPPEIRPSIDRHGEIATKAQRVLSRENLRSVSKSFNARARIIAPEGLKSSAIKRSAEPGVSKERTVRNDRMKESDSESTAAGAPGFARGSASAVLARGFRPRASGEPKARPLTIRKDGSVISRPSLRNEKGSVAERPERESGSRIRSFPLRGSYENESPRPGDKSSAISPPRKNEEKGNKPPFGDQVPPELREKDNGRTVIRKYDSGEPINRVPLDGRSVREQPKSPERNPGSPVAPRNNGPEKIVKERGRSDEGASSAPGRSLQKERERGVTRTYEPRNQSVSRKDVPSFSRQSSPSRIASTPSRKIEPPSRNYSGPSRILNSPSRSSSPPSRSYNSPSPSRSFSAPSRSSSAPSRSSGSSSWSSSPPSRSFSSPSRSSSGSGSRSSSSVSSRSSSSSSSGSGSGRIRKKE